MDLSWLKTPKTKEEEKEQFDKLYHVLVQLSHKGAETATAASLIDSSCPPEDEFTTLKRDILANFSSVDTLTPLQTCKGCDRSFYSTFDIEKHYRQSVACQRCSMLTGPSPAVSFLTFLEKGMSEILETDGSRARCRFCQKDLPSRKAQEKHFAQSLPCNRLAHHTFHQWYLTERASEPKERDVVHPQKE